MHSLRSMVISIIGAGNMGEALLKGLRAVGVPGRRLLMVERDRLKGRRVAARYQARPVALAEAARQSAAIILAVKPQDLPAMLAELSRALRGRRGSKPLIISIAAGVATAAIERRLPGVPVVRVMPNTAARVRAAISAIAPGLSATARHVRLTRRIFAAVGETVVVRESWLDAVTAVSGSGPAYYFALVRALTQAAQSAGLNPKVSAHLARQTAVGAGRLLEQTAFSADELIGQVASKGGTTEAALQVFAWRHFDAVIRQAVQAAARRSLELKRG